MATTKRYKPDIVRYVTVRDAVEMLDRSERTIRRWIKEGRLPFIQDESGFVRINLADIEEILCDRPTTVPSLQEQVTSLLKRVEKLEDQYREQSQQVE